MLQSHAQVAHDLIKRIPRLEAVAEMIAYQEKRYNGMGAPHDETRGAEIPVGARLLKLALDFDKLAAGGVGRQAAYQTLMEREGWYDPDLLAALKSVLASQVRYELAAVTVDALQPDMILDEDVLNARGQLVVASGQEVTRSVCARLQNLWATDALKDTLRVRLPVPNETPRVPAQSVSPLPHAHVNAPPSVA
jgi:hypothetical protein